MYHLKALQTEFDFILYHINVKGLNKTLFFFFKIDTVIWNFWNGPAQCVFPFCWYSYTYGCKLDQEQRGRKYLKFGKIWNLEFLKWSSPVCFPLLLVQLYLWLQARSRTEGKEIHRVKPKEMDFLTAKNLPRISFLINLVGTSFLDLALHTVLEN